MEIAAADLLEIANPALYCLLFDNLSINYSVIDVQGNYVAFNQSNAAHISMGSTKAQEIDPITWQDCIAVMRSKQRVVKEEMFNNKIFLSIKQPLLSSEQVVGIIVLSIDITAQRQAERAKEEFLANMAHDLRTPFSGILSMTSFVYERETDPLNKECLGQALEASRNLLKLMNEVLELSELGSHPIQYSVFNILAEVNQVITILRAEATYQGLTINIVCPSVDIFSDRMRISRILLNLISNAVKFTAKGKINIAIKLKNNKLVIVIADSGSGIAPQHINHIFDKFYKANVSYQTGQFKGAGLGLYITQQFVKELGGQIKVKSELGRGTIFTCTTPLLTTETAA